MRWAAGFQVVMMPSRVLLMIASSVDSMIAASHASVSGARMSAPVAASGLFTGSPPDIESLRGVGVLALLKKLRACPHGRPSRESSVNVHRNVAKARRAHNVQKVDENDVLKRPA